MELEGDDVLADFRQRNRAVRPPRQSQLAASRESQAQEVSASDSGSDALETPLGAKRAKAAGRPPPDNGKPCNMRFYTDKPGWLAVLESAKNKFWLHICTNVTAGPFLTTEHHSADAIACITEAMADFRKDNATIQLDNGIYYSKIQFASMLMLVPSCLQHAPSPNG